ncbi:7586_t:CDS:2 [Funneliformis mosseae]|uniref:7586_t:CDS:1 n=1 Tax=Funneliformis mosseae TaxID=27381 RepID=A0A9N9E1G7_FUNMO|nr:7586_t:CDS:2 [Funneliformis mosseae]
MASLKEIKSCEIVLPSPSLYIPNGTSPLTIKGDIKLVLSAPLKVTQVVLKLHGFSQFNNSQKSATRNLTTKDLIKQKLTVVNVTKTYNTGENLLPFAITIKTPQNLLGSVEGKHAAVRYVLTAELTKASPHAIHKTLKNVILRKNVFANGVNIDEKVVYEDEREGLLNEPRAKVKVEATFESLDNAGVKEVKVEAFEYEMYNLAKFNSTTGSASLNNSSAPKSTTSAPKTKTPTTRATAKIPAFSNVNIPNPHHTKPLLTPPLTIPVSSNASEPVSFEIPIFIRMKPDSNVNFLEIKHEVIMTIRFDKFMLAPLKLEVPISVITNKS